MALSLTDQFTLDLNWYFSDRYNHICIAASAGGMIPKIVLENDEKNNSFHSLVDKLPEKYKPIRNENLINSIKGVNEQSINAYFESFELLARKGLYVLDGVNLLNLEDPKYILVAYPDYDRFIDPYPIEKENLSLIPKTKGAITRRFKHPFNLIKFFDKIVE